MVQNFLLDKKFHCFVVLSKASFIVAKNGKIRYQPRKSFKKEFIIGDRFFFIEDNMNVSIYVLLNFTYDTFDCIL